MPVTLDFKIEGDQQVSRRLEIASDGVKNFSEPLNKIDRELMKSFDDNFGARGGLFGGWAPAAKDYGHPLLEKSGDMRDSFVSAITDDSITFGNTAEYFPYHQSNQPRSKLPRRVMMKIDMQRKNFIVKAFQEYIIKITRTRT